MRNVARLVPARPSFAKRVPLRRLRAAHRSAPTLPCGARRHEPTRDRLGCAESAASGITATRLRTHGWEEQHIANGRRVGEQHDEPVDADAESPGGWHTDLDRLEKVLVDWWNLGIACCAEARL